MIHQNIPEWPTWRSWGPFRDLAQMKQQLDRIFNFGNIPSAFRQSGVFPAINLSEDAHNYYITSELPGVESKDLDIVATGNSISISGERKIPVKEKAKYHRRERESGKFSRAISMPGEIDNASISATLTEGILTLKIPKAEKAKPMQISVR